MNQLESNIRNKIFSTDAKVSSKRMILGRSSFLIEFQRRDLVNVSVTVTTPSKIDLSEILPRLQSSLGHDCRLTLISADHKHTTFELVCAADKAPVSRLINIRIELLVCWISLNALTCQKWQLSQFTEISCNKGFVAVLSRFSTSFEAKLAAAAIEQASAMNPDVSAVDSGSLEFKSFFTGRDITGFAVVARFKIGRASDEKYFTTIASFSDKLSTEVQIAKIAARGVFFSDKFREDFNLLNLVRAA